MESVARKLARYNRSHDLEGCKNRGPDNFDGGSDPKIDKKRMIEPRAK